MTLTSRSHTFLLFVGLAVSGSAGRSAAADDLPPGAVRQLGTTAFRPGGGSIKGLAVVGGGTQVVAATGEGVTHWDLATGRLLGRAPVPEEPSPPKGVDRPEYLLDGLLVPAQDGKAVLLLGKRVTYRYPVPLTGRPPDLLPPLPPDGVGTLARAAFAADGSVLAMTTRGNLELLRPGGVEWARVADGGRPAAEGVHRLAVGRKLAATTGPGGRVRVCELAAAPGGVRQLGEMESGPVSELAVSADDRRVAAIGRDATARWVVRVWDAATRREIGRWPAAGRFTSSAIALSPDGVTVAVGDAEAQGSVALYDAATGAPGPVLPTNADHPRQIAFLPDGSGLVAAGAGGVILHWKLPGGEPARPAQGHRSAVRAVACLPGGGVVTAGADGFVIVYDPAGREARRIEAHGFDPSTPYSFRLRDLTASPDGKRVYTAGYKGLVRAWDVATGRKEAEYKASESVAARLALAVSADGKRVAVGGDVSGVRILSTARFDEEATFRTADYGGGIGFSAGNRLVVAGSGGRAAVWGLDPPAFQRRVQMSPPPPLVLPPVPDQRLPPRSLRESLPFAVSPDGTLFTGPSDGGGADGKGPTLGVWAVADGERVARIDLGGEPALCATFLADGKRVAVGSADGAVRVFELATGAVRHTFRGHRGPVLCLAASADGKHLVSGGLDTTAVVWAVP